MKVFLGGTCNESKWRDVMIEFLKADGIDYFNPVVDDWTEECQKREIGERKNADFVLYAITPKMTGVYAIAEVVDDSNKRPEKTILVVLFDDGDDSFDKGQLKSLKAVAKMVENNGAEHFISLSVASNWMKHKLISLDKTK